MSTTTPLAADALRRALSLRDLTDPRRGPHAMQRLVDALRDALKRDWRCGVVVSRASPVVEVKDNYDRLRYPADAVTRESRYTRYVSESRLLRTHTSAMIPPLLRALAKAPAVDDLLLVCPGLVYRRDCIDRLHTGEPHQVDLWRLRRGPPLGREDLLQMVARVVEATLPGASHTVTPAVHPYTLGGLQIDVLSGDAAVEIGECGLAHPEVLREAGLSTTGVSGLAMGIGLDRILMLRKGLDDIRLLRASDPRIAGQMLDLSPYRPVSRQPAVRRDLSVAMDAAPTVEDLGDRAREVLGRDADLVETVELLSVTPAGELPAPAAARLGIRPGQVNALIRIVLRHLDRALTHDEGNDVRDRIYAALHRGTVQTWAKGPPI